MESITNSLMTAISDHREWAALAIGLLAFGESLAVISLFVPATAVLITTGALIGAGVLPFAEIAIAGIVGCILGDTISYWAGRHFGPRAGSIWPFASRPELLERGNSFFLKHGWAGVFIGRFLGPLRAVVPLSAGVLGMKHVPFQTASVASAAIFIPVLLSPGTLVGGEIASMMHGPYMALIPGAMMVAMPVAILGYFIWRRLLAWRKSRANAESGTTSAP